MIPDFLKNIAGHLHRLRSLLSCCFNGPEWGPNIFEVFPSGVIFRAKKKNIFRKVARQQKPDSKHALSHSYRFFERTCPCGSSPWKWSILFVCAHDSCGKFGNSSKSSILTPSDTPMRKIHKFQGFLENTTASPGNRHSDSMPSSFCASIVWHSPPKHRTGTLGDIRPAIEQGAISQSLKSLNNV